MLIIGWYTDNTNFKKWKNRKSKKNCGFPSGPVVKNPPTIQGGSTSGQVRLCHYGSTKPEHHNYWAHASEPQAATAHALQFPEPRAPRACAPQQETS